MSASRWGDYTPVEGSWGAKLMEVLADGEERSAADLVARTGCSSSVVNASLVTAVRRGVLVSGNRAGRKTWQLAPELRPALHRAAVEGPQVWNAWLHAPGRPLPTPQVSEAAELTSVDKAVAVARQGLRDANGAGTFSLSRDGSLWINCSWVIGELKPAETKALIEYLIAASDTVDEAFSREVAS